MSQVSRNTLSDGGHARPFVAVESGDFVRSVMVCALLMVVTLTVYWPVVGFDFIIYDDAAYVCNNPQVKMGLTWKGFVWAFTTSHASNWHPLTWLFHMLDCQLFGLRPGWHHIVNVLLHAINTMLLFALLRRMTKALWRSALVAALFALHPLHVESVAWIAERKDVLSTFFGFLALFFYVRYVSESKVQSPKFKVYYGLALGMFACGLMSKPMLVTWPFVMLLLDWWPLQRGSRFMVQGLGFEAGDTPRVTRDSRLNPESVRGSSLDLRPIWRLVWEKAPFFILSAASCMITLVAQNKGGAVQTLVQFSAGERLVNAVVSYGRYLGRTAWPVQLALPYPYPARWSWESVLVSMLLLSAMCGFAVWQRRRRPFVFVGWFWFLGTLFPVIGLVQVGGQSMADRYTYVPLVGVFIVLAWLAGEISRQWRQLKIVIVGMAVLALAACGVRTQDQLLYWRNSETMFRHTLAITENNPIAHCMLASYLRQQGRIEEAIRHYDEALCLDQDYSDALNNLGVVRLDQHRYEEAAELCRKALAVSAKSQIVMVNLGNALTGLKQFPEAIGYFNTVLERDPDDELARVNLGTTLIKMGRTEEGMNQFREALRRAPGCSEAHVELAKAFAAQGQLTESISEYQKALEFVRSDASLHYNLGTLLGMAGHGDEAVVHYREALRLKPDYAEAHNNLGIALTLRGELSEAVRHFEVALRLQPENAEAHNNLAYALIQLGRREEAIEHLREALRLRPDYAQARQQLRELGVIAPE